jgi:hypothetical protein
LPIAHTHSPVRSVEESPRGATDDPGANASAVREPDGDPLGALDDVVVRQDAAVGIDDEAAARAAARRIAVVPRRAELEWVAEQVRRFRQRRPGVPMSGVGHPRRRVDVHDGGVDARDGVGKADRWSARGGSRTRTRRAGGLRAGDNRGARGAAGKNDTDEKRDSCSQAKRDDRESAGHMVLTTDVFPL